jgi:ATP/maltotriose-dependent transcriptional regulator MalT
MWYKIGGIQINADNFTFYKAVSLAQQEGYKRVFLIEAGLSKHEIATKLFISINTVKRHISNIYSKLDVKTLTQAVSRGKELGFFEV